MSDAYIDGMTNTTSTGKEVSVWYEVTLTVSRPVRYDNDAPMSEQMDWAVSRDAKRQLEREVLRAIAQLDGDCDCEVMTAAIVAE